MCKNVYKMCKNVYICQIINYDQFRPQDKGSQSNTKFVSFCFIHKVGVLPFIVFILSINCANKGG